MSDDFANSFSIDLGGNSDDLPAEINVKATYGDMSVDDLARQHVIGYLGVPLVWDEESEDWALEVTIGNLYMMERFVADLGAMEFGDDLEVAEDDGSEDKPDVLMEMRFRQYRDGARHDDE